MYASSNTGGGSRFCGDSNRAECSNEGGNGTRADAVEELEEAGDSWEARWLAILLQLCQLLAVHTGDSCERGRETSGRPEKEIEGAALCSSGGGY